MVSRRNFLKAGVATGFVSGPYFSGRVFAQGAADIGVAKGANIEATATSDSLNCPGRSAYRFIAARWSPARASRTLRTLRTPVCAVHCRANTGQRSSVQRKNSKTSSVHRWRKSSFIVAVILPSSASMRT